MTRLAFVDTETTGTNPDIHQVWEVAVINAEHGRDGMLYVENEVVGQVRGVSLACADPMALSISRFYERYDPQTADLRAAGVAALTAGCHMVGAVPSFDAAFLNRWLRDHGEAPAWHYHLIDVEPLVAGYLLGQADQGEMPQPSLALPPWKSTDLAEAVGVSVDDEVRHTALGDARWAMWQYAAVYGLEIADVARVAS